MAVGTPAVDALRAPIAGVSPKLHSPVLRHALKGELTGHSMRCCSDLQVRRRSRPHCEPFLPEPRKEGFLSAWLFRTDDDWDLARIRLALGLVIFAHGP